MELVSVVFSEAFAKELKAMAKCSSSNYVRANLNRVMK